MTRLSDQPCTCTHSTVGEGTCGGCPREDECYARWLATRPDQCPTCGSGPGEECELSSGQSRAEPHADRLLTCLGLIDVLTPK